MPQSTSSPEQLDAVIVGAGFAGMYMLHRLRGLGFSARVFEAGDGVGGTWYWNRYPGARCDIESMEYSFSFDPKLEQQWSWSQRYAPQAEILTYANHIADRYELRDGIQFKTRVTSAVFDEAAGRWAVATDQGDRVSARHCIMATGCLSVPKLPEVPGVDSFAGPTYHTGYWPHEGVDFTGLRVGIIGTGSSAIQSIPHIAEQAAHLTVFQRTPNFSIPAQNLTMTREYEQEIKDRFPEFRAQARDSGFGLASPANELAAVDASEEQRQREYQERWDQGGLGFLLSFSDIIYDLNANATAANFVRGKIHEVVKDPKVAEILSPKDYPIGTKRLCVDSGYYETFNRDNVTLVDLRATPIEAITAEGLRTSDADYAFDAIVFATGFDAMTGALNKIEIRGRDGLALKEKWAGGPRTYLGLQVAGFPNLYTITGPGSPSVLSNMMVSIEQHVDWIADCMTYLREHETPTIEATVAAEDDWVAHVNDVGEGTLFPLANSWYVGANVPGKPRVFTPYIGGFNVYAEKCRDVAAKGYEGFALGAAVR